MGRLQRRRVRKRSRKHFWVVKSALAGLLDFCLTYYVSNGKIPLLQPNAVLSVH